MKVGILSDSHYKSDYTKEVINLLKENQAEYLIHAGDLCKEENLKTFRKIRINLCLCIWE